MKQILLMIAVVVLTGAVVTSSGCVGANNKKPYHPGYKPSWIDGLSKGVQELGRGYKK